MTNHSRGRETERPSAEAEGKAELRSLLRRQVNDLTAADRKGASTEITQHLASWLRTRPVRTVATFASLPLEPDLRGLHQAGLPVDWLYPRVVGTELFFHSVDDPTTLVKGRFGIQEPVPSRHSTVSLEKLQVILCPGVGFTMSGIRLGQGGGFYDRLLSRLAPSIPRLGVFFEVQRCASLPSEAHDVAMTHLANESGVQEVDPTG